MAHPRNNPGGHVIFTQGEKLIEADLERIGTMAEQTALHFLARVFQGADGLPISGFFEDDCKVTASGLTATIAAGWGLYYDSSSSDAWGAHYKPIVISADITQAINAHDATNPRWDLISLAPGTDDDESASRNVKNITTGVVASQTVDKRTRWLYTLTYTAGTPGASPSTPATPSGHIAVARIRVPAAAGAVSVDDLRPRLQVAAGAASEPPEEYAANFVPGSSTELQVTENSPTGMSVLVRDGEAVIQGKRYRYGRQSVTVTAAHATLERIDTIVADFDGTIQCLAGTPGGAAASVAADQVSLATITIPALDAAITDSQITDTRERRPYDAGDHLRDDTVVAAHIGATTKPIRALLSAGAESSNAIAVTVTAQDADGTALTGAKTFLARLYSASMEPLAPADWSLAETGAGSGLTTSGATGLIFDTGAAGTATITVTDDTAAFAGTVYLLVEPINQPGAKTYATLTFS
jgi:hypothetical protein